MSNQSLKVLAVVAFAIAACGKDKPTIPNPGGTPTTLEKVVDAPSTGAVNSVVSPAPSFVVRNEDGEAMATAVTITVSAGGGSLTSKPTQSAVGTTGIGTWTLGKTVGTNTVTVTVNGLTPITFTVPTTTPLPAKKIVEVSATTRTAAANTVVTPTVVVAVRDTFDNAIAGATVFFEVQAGGGSMSGSTFGNTDANGQVTGPDWRLGKYANGTNGQTLRATSGSLTPLDVNATVATSYNISLRYIGSSVSASQQLIFTKAAQRISALLTGDVANLSGVTISTSDFAAANCSGPSQMTNETIDDVLIHVKVDAIDGQNGVLGSAKPCFVRQSSAGCPTGCAGLTAVGLMNFDVADFNAIEQQGTLEFVVTHEMLHVIGIGSLWGDPAFGGFNLIQNPSCSGGTCNPGMDPRYTGSNGIAGCQAIGGTNTCANTVPVHNTDGGGSQDTHWRESVFSTELMTASIVIPSSSNPISTMTIRALQDFGYVVNLSANDTYSIPGGSLIAGGASALIVPTRVGPWEIVGNKSLRGIDLDGRVGPLRIRQ